MSQSLYPRLFSPLNVNGMTLPNRIVVPAMVTRLPGEDGFVNQDTIDRYVRFARGEPGLIVVEATAVHHSKSGQLLRLCDDEYVPGHREMVKRIHAVSPSRVSLQIIHFLKVARSGWRQTVEMLTKEEIQAIVRAYGETAARTREAGYDAVELHMAHAYTLASFMSARNKRTDEYGGRSLEPRMRLMSEVILWPREFLHAPEAPGDRTPPHWSTDGTLKVVLRESGQLRLTWEAALDAEGMYGYEVFRSINDGPFTHLTSSRTTSHVDEHALAGNRYAYFVRPYDLAGNRGPNSNLTEITISPGFEVPPNRTIALDGKAVVEA